MFKVECPGCQAPYQVDERRVPATGLRMRCPKCGTTFQVSRPGEGTPTAILDSAPPAGAPAAPPRRGGALKGTMIGMAAQSDAPAPRPPPLKRPTPPAADVAADADDDLPAVLSGSRGDLPAAKGPPRLPPRRPGTGADESLPAVRPEKPLVPREHGAALPANVARKAPVPAPTARAQTSKPTPSDPKLELDLPTTRRAAPADLPAPAAGKRPALDSLPALKAPTPTGIAPSSVAPISIAPSSAAPISLAPSSAEPISVAPSSAESISVAPTSAEPISAEPIGIPRAPSGSFSSASEPAPDSLDLPSPARDFGADARGTLSLDGGAFGEIDLPTVAGQHRVGSGSDPFALDAPLDPSVAALPSVRPSSNPPTNPFDDPFSLPELDAPGSSVPRSKSFTASFPGFDAGAPRAPSLPPAASPDAAFVEEFDGLDDALTSGSSFDSGAHSSVAERTASKKSGAGYGEVDLGGADDPELSGGASLDTDDGMEFGAIPQEERELPAGETPAAAKGPEPAAIPSRPPMARPPVVVPEVRPKRRWLLSAALALVVGIGGGALALVPTVGPYGFYFFSDLVNAGKYESELRALHAEFERARAADEPGASLAVIERIDAAHRRAPRFAPLAAYLSFTRYAHVLRFGEDSDVQARAKVLLDALAQESADVAELRMARALQKAVDGERDAARKELARIVKAKSNSAELWTSLGELELQAGDAAAAKAAFQHISKESPSAWTLFGLARAEFALTEIEAAHASLGRVLESSPGHAGARLLLGEIAWRARKEAEALSHVMSVLAAESKAGRADRLQAHALLGDIHLGRGRLSKAESEYEAALKLDPKNYRALSGLADAFFAAGRYTAALARYEAALTTDAKAAPARLGIAKAKLFLDKPREAREALAVLFGENPKSAAAAYWLGRAAEKEGERAAAEKGYRSAIEVGGVSDDAALAYVALAQLLRQSGQLDEAGALLTQALEKLPGSAPLHEALGEVSLSQGRYEQALSEFHAARKLDEADVGVLFSIGICHRKLGRFEDAMRVFADVAKLDPDLPGLPLERGLLLEQSGKADEALAEYEAALSKAPDDPDLALRVGCSRVAAGDGAGARPLLSKVLEKRPQAAEAHHCLGRAYFLEDKYLEALQSLQRATDLDPNRAEYFVFVAIVANAAGQVALAQQSVDVALQKDQGLGDAYWQKGVLLLRQGAALDAVQAFDKALELRPSRYEVHADRAQAYYQLGREVEALAEWRRALEHDDDNPTWHFRFGKLLAARRMNAEAVPHLLRAIELAEKREARPPWLWQVHQLAASTLGPTAAALPHWRKFLEQSPEDSPYRDEAKQALARAGQAWTGP